MLLGWACDPACVLADGQGCCVCFKAQNRLTRTAWFSAKFALHHPIIAKIAAQLTTPPTGKWKWMPNKRTFRTTAASLIAKKKPKEAVAFVDQTEVDNEDTVPSCHTFVC